MVDILAIGTGAVNAYRQALSTTSNNIANVNTPGYSRRELILGQSAPVERGAFTFGSGAQAETVARAYNEFVERSLRDATSGYENNTPIVEFASKIVDAVATESASLSGAIDEFFNKAQTLTTDPSSKIFRSEFLSAASSVEARFNELSLQVDQIADEASEVYKTSINEFNALSEQLLIVNRRLAAKTDVSDQAPGLLDERDSILRDMAKLTEIGVIELTNGQVSVNLGGSGRGSLVVTPTLQNDIGMLPEAYSLTDIGALVIDPGGVNRPLPKDVGGYLGGMLAVSSDVLSPMISGLDHLAVTFANEVNLVHRSGLDLQGDFGEDLFSAPISFTASTNTAVGDLTVEARVIDSSQLKSEPYKLMYREHSNSWDVRNATTNEYVGQINHGGESEFLGMSITLIGSPVNGDTIYLAPEARPAKTFNLLIDDEDRVAVAASMRTMPSTDNSSLIDTSLAVIDRESGFFHGIEVKNETDASYREDFYLSAGGSQPAFQVLKGTSKADLQFNLGADQHLHLFSKEGVYVAGTRTLTAAEANRYIAADDGFGDGSFSTKYFNKEGDEAYLNTTIQFGVSSKTEARLVHSVIPETSARVSEQLQEPASLISSSLKPVENGTLVPETFIEDGALTFTFEQFDPNDVNADENGFVSKSFKLTELELQATERMSAALMAEYLNNELSREGVTGVSASATNILRVNNIDLTQSLSINNVEIVVNPQGDLKTLVNSINEASLTTKVEAVRTSESSMVLRNISGHDGENIELGAPGEGDTTTALGMAPGIFAGNYEIKTTGVLTDSTTGDLAEERISLVLTDIGAPSDLEKIGFSTDILIDGAAPDDLAVFVSGRGKYDATIRVTKTDDMATEPFPADSFRVDFTSDTIYTITDLATDTVVSTRLFDPAASIKYQGINLMFSSTPKSGDSFNVTENRDGIGSNENFLRLIDLGKRPILNGQSFSEAYRDLVSGVGNRHRVAELNRDAMQVLRNQAEASRESTVGVNLDEEAADLIRYQQAYQAAAQVIQLSQRMFDALVQMR